MITQIKKIGNSKGVVLPPEFLKFHGLEINDWVDISTLKKVEVEI